jgi:hypothetical protein
MDGSRICEEHPDRKYYNGLPDLENHNLAQVLYLKQMCVGYEQFTHRRSMAYYAGVQHWGSTWMRDNGGGRKALRPGKQGGAWDGCRRCLRQNTGHYPVRTLLSRHESKKQDKSAGLNARVTAPWQKPSPISQELTFWR